MVPLFLRDIIDQLVQDELNRGSPFRLPVLIRRRFRLARRDGLSDRLRSDLGRPIGNTRPA